MRASFALTRCPLRNSAWPGVYFRYVSNRFATSRLQGLGGIRLDAFEVLVVVVLEVDDHPFAGAVADDEVHGVGLAAFVHHVVGQQHVVGNQADFP